MITSFSSEANNEENRREHWNESRSISQFKYSNQQASPLPTKLPPGAHLPSCAGIHTILHNIVSIFFVCLNIVFFNGNVN